MRKSFKENFKNRLVLVPKIKYIDGIFDAPDDLIERLEGDGYVDVEAGLLAPSRVNRDHEVRHLKELIDGIFRVYPRDERAEDGFKEVDVFVFDIDQEDYEDFNRDVKRGRREPVYIAFDLGAVEDHLGDIDPDLHLDESRRIRVRKPRMESKRVGNLRRRFEHVKTDYEGGFTDLLNDVDALLEKYYEDGQVEIVVTDNGFATVTVFSGKNEAETVSVDLSYSDGIATLTDDDGKKLKVNVDVDKDDYDKLADGLINLIDKQFAKNK